MKRCSLVLIVVVISMFSLASCGKIENPQFRRLENFGLKKMDFQQPIVGFSATYYNPNNFSVSVKEAAFDVYVDTVYLGKFTQPLEVNVRPETEFSIPMEGKISLMKAMNSSLPKLAGKEVMIRANGLVKVGKGGVYISRDVDYQGKHKLDLDLIKNPAGAGFRF